VIIYNPDPFYDFDKQIGNEISRGLSRFGIASSFIPTNQFDDNKKYDLYIFCSNTYNFAPDWRIKSTIQDLSLSNKNVALVTLGAGSTKLAQKKLETLVTRKGAILLGSKSYWLFRPNDKNNNDLNNIEIALEKARIFGEELGLLLIAEST